MGNHKVPSHEQEVKMNDKERETKTELSHKVRNEQQKRDIRQDNKRVRRSVT